MYDPDKNRGGGKKVEQPILKCPRTFQDTLGHKGHYCQMGVFDTIALYQNSVLMS